MCVFVFLASVVRSGGDNTSLVANHTGPLAQLCELHVHMFVLSLANEHTHTHVRTECCMEYSIQIPTRKRVLTFH